MRRITVSVLFLLLPVSAYLQRISPSRLFPGPILGNQFFVSLFRNSRTLAAESEENVRTLLKL